jgi:hypothetical protein
MEKSLVKSLSLAALLVAAPVYGENYNVWHLQRVEKASGYISGIVTQSNNESGVNNTGIDVVLNVIDPRDCGIPAGEYHFIVSIQGSTQRDGNSYPNPTSLIAMTNFQKGSKFEMDCTEFRKYLLNKHSIASLMPLR